jgi:hypothetical protein
MDVKPAERTRNFSLSTCMSHLNNIIQMCKDTINMRHSGRSFTAKKAEQCNGEGPAMTIPLS